MLEDIYKMNPALNEKVLAYTPPPSVDITLPILASNWLDELQKMISEADPQLSPNCLYKHIGDKSSYRACAKNFLQKQSQLIYHRLQGNLDVELGALSPGDRQALIFKLTEEIENCSEGLHNRVNTIVDSFQQPRNLDELLYVVRKRLVENVATQLTKEIHTWNGVSMIAAVSGFGIKANCSEDIYSGNLPTATIRRALQQTFAKYFTPYSLPNLLIAAFKELIPELEIEKKSENGIGLQTQEKISGLIKAFLPEHINKNSGDSNDPNNWINYFKIPAHEKNALIFRFVDINSEKMYQSFYYALLNKKYFKNSKPNTLIENAYSNLFLNNSGKFDSPEPIISKLFDEHQYYSLLAQLVKLKEKYPIFYKENIYNTKIKKMQTTFLKNCLAFNDFLSQQLAISEQYSKEITQGFQLILNLNLRNEFVIEQIANSLLVTDKQHFNLLMLGTLNNMELVKNIFDFFKKYEKFINPKIDEKMLLMKNKDHCNAIMIAANKQKEAIFTILGFLSTHIGRLANDTLYKLFTQQQKQDSNTVLTLTACDNSDLLKNILYFFTEHLSINGETFRKLFFPENSNGACTALMLAIKNQADTSLSILKYIAINIKNFDPEVSRKIFLEKNQDGFTILMLAARYHPKVLSTLLTLLNEHQIFPEDFLTSLFLEKNSQNYNFLMLAAECHPQAIAIILEFINKKRKIFSPYLPKLLFDKNYQGYNTLILSRHHPEVMMSILKFICNLPKVVISKTVAEIFLTKNNVGFNFLMLLAKDKPQSLQLIFEFIEKNPDRFSKENLLSLIQEKGRNRYNCLMLAAQNHYDATAAILAFIQKKPKIFSSEFVEQFIATHDGNRTNALMLAATYQPKIVGLLLDFITKKAAPNGPIRIDTLKEIVFEKVHDKKVANAVFFGGRFGYYKSVLLVTSQLTDPTAVNALLKFIDHHIDSLGIEVFIDLLTEKDYQDNYIFSPACSEYPGTLKKILNFIADSATHEALIPVKNFCAQFIFQQLARWSLATTADQELFDKVIEKCSGFLLTDFNKDFFAEMPHNLKPVTDKLFACYLNELEDRKVKKIHYTTNFSFFKWRYSTTQKWDAAHALQKVLNSHWINKAEALIKLKSQYPAIALCRLGNLFAAYQEIVNLQSYEAFEFDIVNAAIPLCRTSYAA